MEVKSSSIPLVTLPPEVERNIFELAAKLWPETSTCLVLVSKYVGSWIVPLLYKSVTISNPEKCRRFLQAIELKEPSFFTKHVKSLCIPWMIDYDASERILSVCRGLENLAYWKEQYPKFDSIVDLRLRRISINVECLSVDMGKQDKKAIFENVTHLQFQNLKFSWIARNGLPALHLLSDLTHLSIDTDIEHGSREVMEVVKHILHSCLSLRLLICIAWDEFTARAARKALVEAELVDDRIVVLADAEDPLEDWEMFVDDDYDSAWSRAERVMAERRGKSQQKSPTSMGQRQDVA